jgi:hypothetical protein
MILVDGVDSEDGVFPNERVAMFLAYQRCARHVHSNVTYKARSDSGNQRFQQLGFADFLQESQSGPSDILIWMLQVISDGVTDHMSSPNSYCGSGTYHTRIISCFNFPLSSSLGQTLSN